MLKLFITLRNVQISENDQSIKMLISLPLASDLLGLKRSIEREYFQLYPESTTFVCTHIEDEYGYKLTQSAPISSFVKDESRLIALYSESEMIANKAICTYSINDILPHLQGYMKNVTKRLNQLDLGDASTDVILELLEQTVMIGFSNNTQVVKDYIGVVLSVNEKQSVSHLLANSKRMQFLFYSLIEYWLSNFLVDNSINALITELFLIALENNYLYWKVKNSDLVALLLKVINDVDNVSPLVKKNLLECVRVLARGGAKPSNPRNNNTAKDSLDLLSTNFQTRVYNTSDNLKKPVSQSAKTLPGHRMAYNANNGNIRSGFIEGVFENSEDLRNAHSQRGPATDNKSRDNEHENKENRLDTTNSFQRSKADYFAKNRAKDQEPAEYIKITEDYKAPADKHDNLFYTEYLALLSSNPEETLVRFAVINLSKDIERSIFSILENPRETQQLLLLIGMPVPSDVEPYVQMIFEVLSENITPQRASEAIANNTVKQLITIIEAASRDLKTTYLKLLRSLFARSGERIDLHTIFLILQSNLIELRISAAELLKRLTDNTRNSNLQKLSTQLENKIKELIDLLKSRNCDRRLGELLLESLANICILDYLKPQIIYMEGIQLLIKYLRDDSLDIKMKRAALRGLFNLSTRNRDLKIKVLSELNYEFELLRKGALDPVVKSLLLTLVKTN